jgi:predicted DNA-binding transcriptional regulator AlpA
MSELVITSKEDLEKMLRSIVTQIARSQSPTTEQDKEDRLDQKRAAIFLGVSQATLIRYKKQGKVPYQQLPGSSKVTYYKSQLKAVLQRNPDILQIARK